MADNHLRGFAAMSKSRRIEIAREGGKASHGGGRRPSAAKAQDMSESSEATKLLDT